MPHRELFLFFLQIAVLLAAALAAGRIARQLRLPEVLGELLGGILLGPTVFGTLAPAAFAWLWPDSPALTIARDGLLRLGMLFFLFVAGTEVDLGHLRRRGPSILTTSVAGVVLPFALGFAAVVLLPDLWRQQAHDDSLLLALFIGTALAISALPVIARILLDLNLLRQEIGIVILAAAAIDDLIGWSLFALILSRFAPEGALPRPAEATFALVLGMFAFFLTVGRRAARRLLPPSISPRAALGVAALLLLLAAATAEAIGIHAVFGAFLAGVALSPTGAERSPAREAIYPFAMGFFAPLYFVSIGLKVNFVIQFDLILALVVLVVACAGKVIGAGLGAWLGGMPPREALAVGFGMNARGAMEIILATVALEHGLIDQRLFVALVVMALVTSLMSGPILRRLLRDTKTFAGDDEESREARPQ